MNAQPQILPLSADPKAASEAPTSQSTPPAPDSALTTMHSALSKRRTSKIARLPKKLRDLINERLCDGVAYDQIVLELKQSTDPPLPYEISSRNLSDWFAGSPAGARASPLFIANLAFDGRLLDSAKSGIFLASGASALAGLALLRFSTLPRSGHLPGTEHP